MTMLLQPGTKAPDFSLANSKEQKISLRDYAGKPLILMFYPADWSPTCGSEIALFNEVLPEFQRLGAQLLGISVDGIWCHDAFAKKNNVRFPLLSDFQPKGAVASQYGAYREQEGFCERALFLIDKNGSIAWNHLSEIKEVPGANGVLEALEKLTK